MTIETPPFSRLPLRNGDPKFSAWGRWGPTDEIGTLNLLTAEVISEASKEIVSGNTVTLNINTQGSSHWDGLRHYPYQDTLQFYNGASQDDISGPSANQRIGIQTSRGITGRGVLLDWAFYAKEKGLAYSPFDAFAITLAQLLEVAQLQKTTFRPGDILFVRTGWVEAYQKLSMEERGALPYRQIRSSCGVEASEEAIQWHWDNQFAAVASDTVAYEAWPSPRKSGVSMHEVFLSGWGMPIGESFDLELLAERCRDVGRWSFFLVSVPLNISRGVASPPNAIAIL
ncbi:hypothetical protein PG999_000196 [Apiospora kogelbergensis]|uniref:Cyclase n=1 Tax=Apiospora kogelbergensis TaxID=1337665 RepID=A0AAW0RB46_9PEZI